MQCNSTKANDPLYTYRAENELINFIHSLYISRFGCSEWESERERERAEDGSGTACSETAVVVRLGESCYKANGWCTPAAGVKCNLNQYKKRVRIVAELLPVVVGDVAHWAIRDDVFLGGLFLSEKKKHCTELGELEGMGRKCT